MPDITYAVNSLVRAAIDAYMYEYNYHIEGEIYRYKPMGNVAVPGAVERPAIGSSEQVNVISVAAEHPRAGAPQHVIDDAKRNLTENLTQAWSGIRASIESATQMWHSLPEPSEIKDVATVCDGLVSGLMGAVSDDGSVLSGAGNLGGRLRRINTESASFGGGAFDLFKQQFIDDSPARAVRLTAIGEVLGQAVAAEANIWTEAPNDLQSVLTTYTDSFAKMAEGGSANAAIGWKVVGSAIAGISLFATAGSGGALALAGAGIVVSLAEAIAKAEQPPKKDERPFSTVDEGLRQFHEAMRTLSLRIRDEEGAIIDGLGETIDAIHAHAGEFQLSPAPIYEAHNNGVMYADPPANLSLARSHIPAAADAVTDVKGKPDTISSDLQSALWRDVSIGYRVAGAAYRVGDLANLLRELLEEFAWDLDRGGQNLELAILDWANQEGENAAKATALAESIESGETHEGDAEGDLLAIPENNDPTRFFKNLGAMMQ